ncbi:hypothetical protein PILCRDRAFT_811388 [Piloderma croceum F 1598]|uniref:Exonuclease domain-containing protein n=1 Tax=Piloderma croceum (strain F 1598) TaxID=765440 RepID=A0A0C3CMJ5_PILCF|nr:hypothetical protein PILCRDRAFT_811388 [Piloderma croceum F 1598]
MVKNLYDHFIVLYETILPTNPNLASEHALRQEDEVYNKSNKLTYRNAVISSIARLKRRPKPDSASHPSVGTEGELVAREESRKSLDSLRITRDHLLPLLLSMDDMRNWGYIIDMPDGPGGSNPNLEGYTMKCERCSQPYMVRSTALADECLYHYGKQFSQKVNGEKLRLYTCCSRPTSEEGGCVRGPHVFYETDPQALHLRHAFSFSRQPVNNEPSASSTFADTALEVAAIDCEMVYTTGGMRCARVSVVDGTGSEVFDELVRMDDGVEIVDYITRFSGVTPENHAKAVLPLTSIRESLDSYINSDTILIGHALDNDLKTLRMIHSRCVDTAILFPHRAGPPYRRALKDLVKEHLGTLIQAGGGSVGHSSVEDSIATLDLVRWYILNKPVPKRVMRQANADGK